MVCDVGTRGRSGCAVGLWVYQVTPRHLQMPRSPDCGAHILRSDINKRCRVVAGARAVTSYPEQLYLPNKPQMTGACTRRPLSYPLPPPEGRTHGGILGTGRNRGYVGSPTGYQRSGLMGEELGLVGTECLVCCGIEARWIFDKCEYLTCTMRNSLQVSSDAS